LLYLPISENNHKSGTPSLEGFQNGDNIKLDNKLVICQICKIQKTQDDVIPGMLIRQSIVESIQKKYPDWSPEGYICLSDLNHFRTELVQGYLEEEKGELSELELNVVKSLREQELLSKDINTEFDRNITFGQRIADKVAVFGGSWRFIIIFGCVLVTWIIINSIVLLWRPYDPYPFILLNLILSCLAAIQAPVIMMSQNRQEVKDRLRGEHDYEVNLKAELEIRHLSEKIDHLLSHQWQRLLEIQQVQMEVMEELSRKHSEEDTQHIKDDTSNKHSEIS
jgi:uncharacterized membrane protein